MLTTTGALDTSLLAQQIRRDFRGLKPIDPMCCYVLLPACPGLGYLTLVTRAQRSYSYRNGGEWKDGPPINFKAAPYSAIAANVTIPVPSEDPSKRAIKIYVQEEGTNHIRELVRESGASQFTPQPVNTSRLPGIPGTKIAADAFQAGATETYYQVSEPTLRWYLYIDGVGGLCNHTTLKVHLEQVMDSDSHHLFRK